MKKLLFSRICLLAVVAITFFASCNKDLPEAIPITTVYNAQTLNNFITTDTAFTFYNALVIKAGLSSLMADSSLKTSYTVYAPNNNAFRASGFSSTAAVSALSQQQAAGIVTYTINPGREFVFTDFPTTFPNVQLPTLAQIGILPIPGTTTFPFNLTNFPSRRAVGAWLNATPLTSFDLHFRNGVLHTLAAVVSPPTRTLRDTIYRDAQFTMFDSLIARGDQAQPAAASKVDSILNNPGANLTVFAPTNTAVKAFINAASGGAIPLAAPDATFFVFIRTSLPAQNAQGIVLYHILGTRAFSVNFSATPTLYPTLLNMGIPTHPGVNVQSVFAANGLTVTSIKVIGLGTLPPGGTPFSSPAATSTAFDRNAVNGVFHVIDRLLLPQ